MYISTVRAEMVQLNWWIYIYEGCLLSISCNRIWNRTFQEERKAKILFLVVIKGVYIFWKRSREFWGQDNWLLVSINLCSGRISFKSPFRNNQGILYPQRLLHTIWANLLFWIRGEVWGHGWGNKSWSRKDCWNFKLTVKIWLGVENE